MYIYIYTNIHIQTLSIRHIPLYLHIYMRDIENMIAIFLSVALRPPPSEGRRVPRREVADVSVVSGNGRRARQLGQLDDLLLHLVASST